MSAASILAVALGAALGSFFTGMRIARNAYRCGYEQGVADGKAEMRERARQAVDLMARGEIWRRETRAAFERLHARKARPL